MASSFDFSGLGGYGVPNLYEFLEVDINATKNEILKSYRAKALHMHPDKITQQSNHEQKPDDTMMKYLNKAREILFDPEKRIKYDEYLTDDDSSIPARNLM